MRVVVYSRVSTDAQERDGTSLDTQERACLEFARRSGWLVIDSIRDSASGYTLDRPGLARVRQRLHDGVVDMVLAYAVDRLSRSQTQIGVIFEEVSQADARLEFVTEKFEDTAVGRLILSVRAFAAEIEREKIAERTMRGKLERANSGKLPQAFGKGCYGYVYNRATGKREIEPLQAETVRRIFLRYAESRSFHAVARELNADGIPTFANSRWHPITVRQTLRNESYTGRLIYRRTKSIISRGVNGKKGRRYVERPQDEWVMIEGASPRIIDDALWDRVQSILDDPQRIARNCAARYAYSLRGRVTCANCGSAMVGQTMRPRGREYHYYCCRVAFNRLGTRHCTTRNVRAEKLEEGIWREVRAILSNPRIVLNELERAENPLDNRDEIERFEHELESIVTQQKRLAELFTLGAVDDDVVQAQGTPLKQRRAALESRLAELNSRARPQAFPVDDKHLGQVCAAIGAWVDQAGDDERSQILEALQIKVSATPERAEVTGVIPNETAAYLPCDMHRHHHVKVRVRVGADGAEDAGAGRAGKLQSDLAGVDGVEGLP